MEGKGSTVEKTEEERLLIGKRQWIFAGAIVVCAVCAWFLLYLVGYEGVRGFRTLIFAASAFLILTVLLSLSFLFLAPRRLAILTYAGVSALFLLPFALTRHFGWEIFLGAGAIFVSLIMSNAWTKREQKITIQFSYRSLTRRGLAAFITGVAFALTLMYISSPRGKISDIPQLGDGLGEKILIPVEYLLKPVIPEFRHDMKIREVKELSAREVPKLVKGSREVTAIAVRELFSRLPKEEQEKTIGNFLQNFVNHQLKSTLAPYKRFFPFLYIIGLFLLLRSIGVPLSWVALGVGWIAMKILLKAKILKIQKVMAEKEEVSL